MNGIPLMHKYWQNKNTKLENRNIYTVSIASNLNSPGSINGGLLFTNEQQTKIGL